VTAYVADDDFASRLERALARSAPKLIEAKLIKANALDEEEV
jgi:hypothetical protein